MQGYGQAASGAAAGAGDNSWARPQGGFGGGGGPPAAAGGGGAAGGYGQGQGQSESNTSSVQLGVPWAFGTRRIKM